MTTAIMKWFDDAKGYGFARGEDGQDVFVHHSQIQTSGFRTLDEGDLIECEVVSGPKGLSARNVSVIRKADNC